jgi:hypothetical protein
LNKSHHSFLFELRVRTSEGMVVIEAYEVEYMQPNHTKVTVVVKLKGKEIFKFGDTWCGIPSHHSLDGSYAKETVLHLISIKPGDTDPDYFKHYTEEQKDFADSLGEELFMAGQYRYCDPKTGEVRQ